APASFAYPYGYSSRRVREAVRETGYAQALAVGNGLARRAQGPYALRRVTVRRSTTTAEFERLVQGRAIGRTFARDRALTKGYAVVRRARQARRAVARALSRAPEAGERAGFRVCPGNRVHAGPACPLMAACPRTRTTPCRSGSPSTTATPLPM